MNDNIADLRAAFTDLATTLKDVGLPAVREQLTTICQRIDTMAEDASSRDHGYPDESAHHIGVRPFLGAVIAFGAGLMIGRLLDR